jgi:hypothetical protein
MFYSFFLGGFGQGPWLEAHGGSTYCAVAALCLMGKLGKASVPAKDLFLRGGGCQVLKVYLPVCVHFSDVAVRRDPFGWFV